MLNSKIVCYHENEFYKVNAALLGLYCKTESVPTVGETFPYSKSKAFWA